MRKLTRKLFISILAAVFAVVALGTSTFAWITVSNTANVDQFGGSIEADTTGIEISIDGTNYFTSIPDITEATTKNTKFTKFSDLESLDGQNFTEYVFNSNAAPTVDGTADAAAKHYFEAKVYVRRTDITPEQYKKGTTKTISLKATNVSFGTYASAGALEKKPITAWTVDRDVASLSLTKGSSTVNGLGISNAARLSFTEVTDSSLATNNYNKGVAIVYEQAAGGEDNNTCGYEANGFAHEYLKSMNLVLPTEPVFTYGVNANKETIKAGTDQEVAVIKGAPVEIMVRVWVEGWDSQAHKNILNDYLKVAFAFSATLGEAETL